MVNLLVVIIFTQMPFPMPQTHEKTIEDVWVPWQFKGTEYFKYEVTGIESGEKKKGYEIIEIKKVGEKYKVKIEGKYGESEGSFTTTVASTDDIPGVIMSQMMFNPYLVPLGLGLFSHSWFYYFQLQGVSWEVGSKWKNKDEQGNITEMEITGYEKYAGKKGKKLVVKQNGKEVYVIVWAKDVALPLYLKMGEGKENIYELKLVKYKE